MNRLVSDYVARIELGDSQQFENVGIIPLLMDSDENLKYLVMKEALEAGLVKITEVDLQGSVSSLKVVNQANLPVLMLDGEELAGGKQDRVLNTTVLLKPRSEATVPVSCAEQGRWSGASNVFNDSKFLMAYEARGSKNFSVSSSLEKNTHCRCDQEEIWRKIHQMQDAAWCNSPTRAMRDVFKSRMKELEDCLKNFRLVPRQKGLIVAINGNIAGFDMVSQESAYAQIHSKLVWSYAIEGLLRKRTQRNCFLPCLAREFLQQIGTAESQDHPSVGLGSDFRFKIDRSVGSMLVYNNSIIHASFCRLREDLGALAGPISSHLL